MFDRKINSLEWKELDASAGVLGSEKGGTPKMQECTVN